APRRAPWRCVRRVSSRSPKTTPVALVVSLVYRNATHVAIGADLTTQRLTTNGVTTRPNPATQLTLRGIGKSYGHRLVLDAVSLTISPGERVGIVGENGSGKSTLLRILAGLETPDTGVAVCTAPGGVGIVEQTLDADTVGAAVDAALA